MFLMKNVSNRPSRIHNVILLRSCHFFSVRGAEYGVMMVLAWMAGAWAVAVSRHLKQLADIKYEIPRVGNFL